MELAAELLGGERDGAPELFQDLKRNVLVLREDRQLLESADVFTGQPPEARSDRPGDGLATGFEILAVEDGQALGVQGLHHLPEGPFRRKAIFLHQIPELTVDD